MEAGNGSIRHAYVRCVSKTSSITLLCFTIFNNLVALDKIFGYLVICHTIIDEQTICLHRSSYKILEESIDITKIIENFTFQKLASKEVVSNNWLHRRRDPLAIEWAKRLVSLEHLKEIFPSFIQSSISFVMKDSSKRSIETPLMTFTTSIACSLAQSKTLWNHELTNRTLYLFMGKIPFSSSCFE